MSEILPLWAARVFNTPLMIHPGKLSVVLDVIRARGIDISHMSERIAQANTIPEQDDYDLPGAVAVIPIYGTLVHRASGMQAMSGFTSYRSGVIEPVNKLADDPSVAAILLDIASPGGEVNGAFAAADAVYAASQKKPVWAFAHDYAFSAAYLLGSAASKLVMSHKATAMVGSIGVVAAHVDQSEWEKNEGYKVTTISAGAHKTDLSPHEPLSDGARARLQADIDAIYENFVMYVSANRGVSEKAVRATEADVYFAGKAIELGLADGVMSIDEAISELMNISGKRPVNPGAAAPLSTKGEDMADDVKTEAAGNQPAPKDNVIDLDAARKSGRDEVAEIVDLCAIAGHAELASKFIRDGVSASAVRSHLLELAAARSEASAVSSAHGDQGDKANNYGWDSVIAKTFGGGAK